MASVHSSKDIFGAIGGSIFGVLTAGVGAHQDNWWAIITGSAIGSASFAWVFGIWLRDRSMQYLRTQNDELWSEVSKLGETVRDMRLHQAKDAMHLSQQDIHLDQQDIDADRRASEAMADRKDKQL